VHHLSINVFDVETARRFYGHTLGLERRADRPDLTFGGAWPDAGGQQVHLIEATANATRQAARGNRTYQTLRGLSR
jgi:catechol 2,3-dioxygenase-like lactoylglutathione lyase family enzyme